MYCAIDLKSFYASVECVARGLDPLTALLVVADASRTDKTICLAVSPALKAYGLSGRCRLFEVAQKAREVERATGRPLSYIVAPPRMRLYMDTSARIYERVYLRFFAPEDIHVYSVDEVFIDLSAYLRLYGSTPRELTARVIRAILAETGLTATAGIGTNLYLAKVAMDILAKHEAPDADGVRIAQLDEAGYRQRLWGHQPLTDFWRIGPGIARRLGRRGLRTMGDVARRSLENEDELYREFGIDAELLIDHAWGQESCTMADIKAFRPETRSVSVGQVLTRPYTKAEGRVIVREMADGLAAELAERRLTCDCVSLMIGYDREAVDNGRWRGPVEPDYYGRLLPRPGHGTRTLTDLSGQRLRTCAPGPLIEAALAIYEQEADPELSIRRFYLYFDRVRPAEPPGEQTQQLDMFTDPDALARASERLRRDERLQRAVLGIRGRWGKNAVLRLSSYTEGATARERNRQIGGHAAGEEAGDGPV